MVHAMRLIKIKRGADIDHGSPLLFLPTWEVSYKSMKFLQFIRTLFYTRTNQITEDFGSNSIGKNLPVTSKTVALLDLNLLSENWYGTPYFTENYQLDISDGYPEDFVPFELSKNKLNPIDYVLRDN